MENVINFDLLKEYDTTLKDILKVWQKEKSYSVNDTIQYKGNYLKCITAGTSGTTTLNFTGLDVGDTITDGTVIWEIIEPPSGGGVDLPEWQANTSYTTGKYLVHEGTVYKVDNDFTSGTTFSDTNLTSYIAPIMEGATSSTDGKAGMVIKPTTTDIDKFLKGDGTWGSAGGGISIWQTNTNYAVNDVVIDSNLIWQCATAHTSTTTFDESKWICISGGEISNGLEIVPLWEGSFSFNNSVEGTTPTSSTPMIELIDSLTKFDYVYITVRCGSESNSCVVPQGIIVGGEAIRVGVFASKDYYTTANINCYDSSHLYINYTFTYQWPVGEITKVQGIRKAKPIVSSGMKYETLWEGEAGSISSTSTATITLTEPYTKYEKIGITASFTINSYEFVRYFETTRDLITASVNYMYPLGYGSETSYIGTINVVSPTELSIYCQQVKITKVVGISEGVQIPTGVQAARVTLWEGMQSFKDNTPVLLSDNINNYDILEFTISSESSHVNMATQLIDVKNIPNAMRHLLFSGEPNYQFYAEIKFSDFTHFYVDDYIQSGNTYTGYVNKVVGIKYIKPDSYSTEEKLIGTWIDGKPLYRKVFENVVDNTNSGLTSSTATIVKLYGCFMGGDGTISMLPNTGIELYIVSSSGVIRTTTPRVLDYVVVEYTKN